MNFIFVSPNFPTNYYLWVEALHNHGVNVLGVGDSPYWELHPRLRECLTEYYYANLSDMGQLEAACRYYQDKYGKIDYIESDNEWWLYSDALLREKFGVDTGFHPADMRKIKAKSAMKEYFNKGGAKTMRYVLVDGEQDKAKAQAFRDEVGYPLFVKPNIGVGAVSSYSIHDDREFEEFFKNRLPETYIMEEYVEGFIVSYDGICDSKSNVVFDSVDHFMTPIADIVNEKEDYYYYNTPFELPFFDLDKKKFREVGRKVVKAFGIKKRFFHIEFFVLTKDRPGLAKKGDFVALECNMRPAGGYTPDLIDFANSVSVYDIYADVICFDENRQKMDHPKYYAFASARRDGVSYLHSEEEILSHYHDHLCLHGRYPAHMAVTMGDSFYYAKFDSFEEGQAFDRFVRSRK